MAYNPEQERDDRGRWAGGNPHKYQIEKNTPFGRGVHGTYFTKDEAKRAVIKDTAKKFLRPDQLPKVTRNPHYNTTEQGHRESRKFARALRADSLRKTREVRRLGRAHRREQENREANQLMDDRSRLRRMGIYR